MRYWSRCWGRAIFCSTSRSTVSSVALIEIVPGKRRALSRRLHRTVARRVHRPQPVAVAALELRTARKRPGPASAPCRRTDRRADAWRQPRYRVAFRQAGARKIDLARIGDTDTRRSRATAPVGPRLPSGLTSRLSTSPNAIPRSPRSRKPSANSSTPGRSMDLSARAHSPPSSAGGRTSGTFRRTAAVTTLAPVQRYICCGRAPALRVRSWTPLEDPYTGFLITHNEIRSRPPITSPCATATRCAIGRPAIYAYHPCDDAVLIVHGLGGKNFQLQQRKRLMMEEIADGIDELGVLLMGHKGGVYWYGSRLSIEQTRAIIPHKQRHLAAR